jgi:hypothetical protein
LAEMIMDLIRELLRAVVTSSKRSGFQLLGVLEHRDDQQATVFTVIAAGNAIYDYPRPSSEKFIRTP